MDIARLFLTAGWRRHGEMVSQLGHALQCAALARRHRADDEVVLAALLHDVGHLVSTAPEDPESHHGAWGGRLVRPFVPPRVAWLVEHHVVAKRYLCTVSRDYAEGLSPVSLSSWFAQGGRLPLATLRELDAHRWFADALKIREWDDSAKDPRAVAPPILAYRDLVEACFGPQAWGGGGDRHRDVIDPSPSRNNSSAS